MASLLPDALTRRQPAIDLTVQPVAPSKEVSEVLSSLSAGQRVFADILAALPNGTYRAVVNQRDLVLSLPFSAKAGDSLELEVVNSDGRVAFAVVPKLPAAPVAVDSASTTLSPAGRLIGQLLAEGNSAPAGPKPLPLAGGQPLLDKPPTSGALLAPVLQGAVEGSGLFYEAHQARWLDGSRPLASLLAEPQNQSSESRRSTPMATASATIPDTGLPVKGSEPHPEAISPALTHIRSDARAVDARMPPAESTSLPAGKDSALVPTGTLTLSKEVAPIVQHQLQALASGTHVWQGQIWPGQQMQWEIVEDDGGQEKGSSAPTEGNAWRTRLRLVLPTLGEVTADLRLQQDHVEVRLLAPTSATRLHAETADLENKLALAGITLAGITVDSRDGVA